MTKKPSSEEASEAGKEAHSPDPETRKEAMQTLREKRDTPASGKARTTKSGTTKSGATKSGTTKSGGPKSGSAKSGGKRD